MAPPILKSKTWKPGGTTNAESDVRNAPMISFSSVHLRQKGGAGGEERERAREP